jgi:hypothetical protein
MARADVYASALEGREVVVTVIAPGVSEGTSDRRIANSATGGRSGSDPVAASEEEHPLHALHSTAVGGVGKIASVRQRLCVCIQGGKIAKFSP